MKRQSVGIDLDTTLNTIEVQWLDLYNKDYNDNLTPDDLKVWDTSKCVKPECGSKIYDYLLTPHFFRNLNIQPNAFEVTKWLAEYFDLYIVTAYSYQSCADKAEWVKEYLPHIDVRNIIFCNDKSKVDIDYLIDDGGHNFFDENGNKVFKGKGILLDKPYNQYIGDRCTRVKDWLEIKPYFENELKRKEELNLTLDKIKKAIRNIKFEHINCDK